MKSIKVEGSLGKNRGDSGVRHTNGLLSVIIVILFVVGFIMVSRGYIRYQLNSEKFYNAHATIEQLSGKYGYVDEYNLILEERIKADKYTTDGRMNKIYYLDRQELNKEDYLKYTDVRDYYVGIMNTPYTLNILGTVLTMFSLGYLVTTLLKL